MGTRDYIVVLFVVIAVLAIAAVFPLASFGCNTIAVVCCDLFGLSMTAALVVGFLPNWEEE